MFMAMPPGFPAPGEIVRSLSIFVEDLKARGGGEMCATEDPALAKLGRGTPCCEVFRVGHPPCLPPKATQRIAVD